MNLRHIKGNTLAVESNATAVGIYLFTDRECLLIDSGPHPAYARELLQMLEARGWEVHAIFNTHGHADHSGGNHCIQENRPCHVYASAIEAAFMENPLLVPYAMYSAYPPKLLQSTFFMPSASRVSHTVAEGPLIIKDKRFEVLELGGHTLGHLGIRTPDDVVFAGDSLLAAAILEAHPCLYLADPGQQLISLQKLEKENCSCLYLSHGGLAADAGAVINANRAVLVHNLDTVQNIIGRERSLEAIIHEFAARLGLAMNRNHYFRLAGGISALLAYLCNNGRAAITMKNNTPHYRARSFKQPG
ncbi:MAG: MBL fold metallo-hydrolase [Syntrophomonadaceae bacterium]